MNSFGERIAFLRGERNYSRKDLAEKIGVSVRQISYWECDQRECDFATLVTLADTFDVSIDFLLGRKQY